MSEAHVAAVEPVHDGPGHRFADPSYCGGCWWHLIGCWQPAQRDIPHASDCPACQEAR